MLSGPWFCEDSRVAPIVVFINLLCIPFELAHKLGIDEVVHDPVPHRAAPSLVFEFFTLKIAGHHVSLKLDE